VPVSQQQIIDRAKQALGTPYIWGGDSLTGGVDCSGLVQQVYASFGIQLPRVTYQQINTGQSVQIGNLQPGDLVFFDTDKSQKGPDHVGIYLGGGKFIHAPKPGDSVKISSLTDSYYSTRWMGGRRILDSGASTGDAVAYNAGVAAEASAPVQPTLSPQELAEQYGMSYSFFKSQPELMKLLKSAVSETWTADVFTSHLKNTKWWKDNSASARQSQVLAKTDPATYKANIGAAQAAAQEMATKMGAILSVKQVSSLAKNMVDYAWNDAQIQNFLGQYVDFTAKHTLGGQAATAATAIGQYAYNQGLKVSDQTVKNQAALLARGLTSMQGIQDGLRQQAISTYPGFADQIMGGATMRDIAQPYIQMTAQQLELPESEITVWHPKVAAALGAASGQGLPAPLSLPDFATSLRTDPQWRKTQGAQSQAMAVGASVLGSMGLVAS